MVIDDISNTALRASTYTIQLARRKGQLHTPTAGWSAVPPVSGRMSLFRTKETGQNRRLDFEVAPNMMFGSYELVERPEMQQRCSWRVRVPRAKALNPPTPILSWGQLHRLIGWADRKDRRSWVCYNSIYLCVYQTKMSRQNKPRDSSEWPRC